MTITQTRARQEVETPHNTEAEQAVLGSLIIDPDAYRSIADKLKPDHFWHDSHRILYQCIMELQREGIPPDFLNLCDRLDSQGKLDDIGIEDIKGDAYITSLVNVVSTSLNIAHYTNLVLQPAQKRSTIALATSLAQLGYSGTGDIIGQVQGLVTDFLREQGSKQEAVHVGTLFDSWLLKLEKIQEQDSPIIGVPSGFRSLDSLLKGFGKKTLNILAARPACGKTSLALNIAVRSAKQGYTILFYSLEMSLDELVTKLISMESGIDSNRLKVGDLHDDEWPFLLNAIQTLSKLPLWLDDNVPLTVADMKVKTERLMVEEGVDMVIVDYLQLMYASENTQRSGDRVRITSEVSRDLKLCASMLDIPILALAQLSREVEKRADKHPQLSDLRESGSIEQDANVVMFIYRDELYNPDTERPNMADIIVAKNRTGPVGEVVLHFTKQTTSFFDIDVAITEEGI